MSVIVTAATLAVLAALAAAAAAQTRSEKQPVPVRIDRQPRRR